MDLRVTPAVMQAWNTARSFRKCSANDSANLVEIATDSMLSELLRPGLYAKAFLTDVAHQKHEAESVVEYPFAMPNVQRYSVGEETESVQNTSKGVTTLPAKAYWNAASDEMVASLKKNDVYTLVQATAVLGGCQPLDLEPP